MPPPPRPRKAPAKAPTKASSKASAKSGRHRFHQVLHHLGWSLASLGEPQPLGAPGKGRQWQVAPLPDGQVLVLIFVPERLPALEQAFRAYEDLAPLHRELQSALKAANVVGRHVLLLDDDDGAQFIDFVQEDVLLDVRGRDEMTERLMPILNLGAVARGSLGTFPRKTPRQRARELADWTKVWSTRLGAAAGTTREQVVHFFHWLHLARLAEQLEIGPTRKLPFALFAEDEKTPQPVRYLAQTFRPLHDSWNLLQGGSTATQEALAQAAHTAKQLVPCLRSYSYLSRSKFGSALFSEAFADDELRLVGWRHSLTAAELPPADEPGRWLTEPAVVMLDDVGFAGLLAAFDRTTEDLRLLARTQAVARERGERPGLQLDLLGGDPPPAISEEDAPRLALQSGLRVQSSRRDRGEVARLVLLAHAAEWMAKLRRPDPVFPIPKVLVPDTPAAPKRTLRPPVDGSMN